jgi:mannosyltransferase OCH1-like enzyme
MYVDTDSECIKPHDALFNGKTCCFSLEQEKNGLYLNKVVVSNALMAGVPRHPFMRKIIDAVFSYTPKNEKRSVKQRYMEIMTTTGPYLLTEIYDKYADKEQVFLIPAKYVSPYSIGEVRLIRKGFESEEFDNKLKESYSIHYFYSDWFKK